jgi:predicted dithiol-disulfide oxidoreductase (DUF899 family)
MRGGDALAAERRELPMVKVTKPYTFERPQGKVTLLDLFEGRKQLLIYHFMLAPDREEGCSGMYQPLDATLPPVATFLFFRTDHHGC